MSMKRGVISTKLSLVEISYSGKGTFIRIDSIYAIQAKSNPDFVIYFDLDSQKVTPVYGNDTLEVISADWDRIKDYFKSH